MSSGSDALQIEVRQLPAGSLMTGANFWPVLVFDRDPGDRRRRHILQTAADVTPPVWSVNAGKGATAKAASRYAVPVSQYRNKASDETLPEAAVSQIVNALAQRCRAKAALKGLRGVATILTCPDTDRWYLGAYITESN